MQLVWGISVLVRASENKRITCIFETLTVLLALRSIFSQYHASFTGGWAEQDAQLQPDQANQQGRRGEG
jgi:hypothetical protein